MIELTASTAFMLYLAATLTLLLGLWTTYNLRSRRRTIIPSSRQLMVCEYCHYAYLEDNAEQVSQCPQCQSYNKNNAYTKKG